MQFGILPRAVNHNVTCRIGRDVEREEGLVTPLKLGYGPGEAKRVAAGGVDSA